VPSPAQKTAIGQTETAPERPIDITLRNGEQTTFANQDDAARVVRTLVEERLIACGNLLPGARSIYRWEDRVQDEPEVVAILKTRKQDFAVLVSRLHELHPNDTPECLAVRVAAGAPKYLAWLEAALAPEQP
jgi:periplasmic divalent cation tolerance protein